MGKVQSQQRPSSEQLDRILHWVIPQRLAWMPVARSMFALQKKHPGLPLVKVYVETGNGYEHAYDGFLTTMTDNAISMAIFHGRALLEFLGLGVTPGNPPVLKERRGRKPGDIGIEHFSAEAGHLRRVSLEDIRTAFIGKPDPTPSWATLLAIANQRLAHSTEDLSLGGAPALDIAADAFETLPQVVGLFLYDALGVKRP